MDDPRVHFSPIAQQEPCSGQPTDLDHLSPQCSLLEKPTLDPIITSASSLVSGVDGTGACASPPTARNGQRHDSNASAVSQIHHQNVYRRPFILMILSLILGVACCVALHCWYLYHDGRLAYNQQFCLRVGTLLAYFAQVSFVYSIQISFEQWLWRELKKAIISFRGIDAGFAALNDPVSFLNWEMLRAMKMASTLALIAWFMFIPTLITPATLNVRAVMVNSTSSLLVPALDISQAAPYTSYTYTVIGDPPSLQKYLGPRTIITRIAVAAGATGEILALPPPATNATYIQTFFAPYVHCEDSTSNVRQQVDGMIQRTKQDTGPSLEIVSLDYFAAIPALNNLGDTTGSTVEVANLTDVDDALHASNQLWIYFSRYNASRNFSEPREDHYLTCSLYNASYATRYTWRNGRQNLYVEERKLLNRVFYPANASTTVVSEVQMSYSAVFWALGNQLTGTIAFYKDLNASNDATQQTYASRIYSKITSNIAQTVLLGTSDLNSHFMENHLLGNTSDGNPYSTQRLQDVAYAHNKTLDVLIPELSSNITHSLLTDPLLAPGQTADVTISTMANVFTYQWRNVAIAYPIAGFVALLANIAGWYAFRKNGVSHNMSFSSIACSTHGVHFSRELRAYETGGALPLPKRIAETLLAFLDGRDGRHGFAEAGMVAKQRGRPLWKILG